MSGTDKLDATEWESTINIPITREEYDTADSQHPLAVDVIFLFKNGTRLSARRLQRKITLKSTNVFGFYRGHRYPISRTTANEKDLGSNDCSIEVVRATHRKLTVYDRIRLSYNKEENEKGERYFVEYEIEYACNTTYAEILHLEEQLMRLAVRIGHFPEPSMMNLENIFACVMSKVQMWHCFDDRQPYKWAYKWNGVKAKLIVDKNKDLVYLWPDAGQIRTEKFHGTNRALLADICLLVELMDDRVVIIEAIGSEFNQSIYTTEPITNIAILDHFHALLGDARIGDRPLIVQRFYDPPKPFSYDTELYDGFIIVQNDIVIKWKIPTIDVKCVAPYTYTVAGTTLKLADAGIEGAIYEVSPSYEIIRLRTDRIAASSENEYSVFLKSIDLLRAN